MYCIIDTNEWIFSLPEIQTLIEQNHEINFVISWRVLQRLDKLKRGNDVNLSCKAAEASKFIYLQRHNKSFIFETAKESRARCRELCLFASDRILGTALHYQEKGKRVIVCTEDTLFQTKCFANEIHSSTVRNLHQLF